MLNCQRDVVAGSQKLHHGFLMGGRADIGSVHLQDSVSHSDFSRLLCNSVRNNLKEKPRQIGQGRVTIFTVYAQLTCEIKTPGSWAPNGTHEWSVPPIMLKPKDPWFFGSVTSLKHTELQLKFRVLVKVLLVNGLDNRSTYNKQV